mgnify:CR=1 FL=1
MSNSVQVVIVNYKTSDLTLNCINSVLKYTNPQIITIVDNSESREEVKYLRGGLNLDDTKKYEENHWIRTTDGVLIELIISSKNLGFGGGCNLGVFQTSSPQKHIWFLNSDCLLFNNALSPLLQVLNHNIDYGIVSSTIVDPPSTRNFTTPDLNIQVSGVKNFLGLFFNTKTKFPNDSKDYINSDYAYGASFILNRKDYLNANGFDESYFMYLEETDLVLRIKKITGKKCCFSTKSIVIHLEGSSNIESNKKILITRNYLKFIKKNYKGVQLLIGYFWYFLKLVKNYF